MIASFFIWLAVIITLMIFKVPHDQWVSDNSRLCGPIPDMLQMQLLITDFLELHSITNTVYSLLTYYPFLILSFYILVGRAVYVRAIHVMLHRYIDD